MVLVPYDKYQRLLKKNSTECKMTFEKKDKRTYIPPGKRDFTPKKKSEPETSYPMKGKSEPVIDWISF